MKENDIEAKVNRLESKMEDIDTSLYEIRSMLSRMSTSNNVVEVKSKEVHVPYEHIIDEVMDNFDFDKVHEVMEFLDWEWVNKGVPTIDELKKEARRLLVESVTHKTRIATGGFVAEYDDGGDESTDPAISLHFVIEDWCNY